MFRAATFAPLLLCLALLAAPLSARAVLLVGPAGQPVAGATVKHVYMERDELSAVRAEVRTDAEGQFVFSDNPAGDVNFLLGWIVATHPDWGMGAWHGATYAMGKQERFEMAARGRVQGQVLDPAGRPLADAVVTAAINGRCGRRRHDEPAGNACLSSV